MTYKQLTCEQRYTIYSMKKNNFTQTSIAEVVGVHKSTISRELKRNRSQRGYRYKFAHNQALNRCKGKASCRILQPEWELVEKLIKEDWSPEQISGRLKHKHGITISHERIYQYILADKQSGGSLYKHLRCQKKRKKRYGSNDRRGSIKNRVSIDERPAIVDKRGRTGDWPARPLVAGGEGDTIIGKNHKPVNGPAIDGQAIVTLAERKSRRVMIQKANTKQAAEVTLAIKKLLSDYKELVLTLTLDNGKEFSHHEQLAKDLGADIYFAHPYSSYERGLNENCNGLIRQYFPKGSDFTNITENQIKTVEDKLNNRPRKCLDFLTPNEVFFNHINAALDS